MSGCKAFAVNAAVVFMQLIRPKLRLRFVLVVLIITHIGDCDKCLAMWSQEGQHELIDSTLPFQEFQGFFLMRDSNHA